MSGLSIVAPAVYGAAMSDDPELDVLDSALPKCPRCLVLLDVDGPAEMPYLSCGQCGDMFW